MDPVEALFESWTFDWRAGCALFVTAALYLRGWLTLRAKYPYKFTPERAAAFSGGLLAVLFALDSPLDAFARRLLAAHMVQYLLLVVVAAPLILIGQPVLPLSRGLPECVRGGVLWIVSRREFRRLARTVAHPLVSWLALASVVAGWHLPLLYELALQSPVWRWAEYNCYVWTALLFWCPVIRVWPYRPVWPRWAMIPYLLLAENGTSILCAILTFSDHVLYKSYQITPRLFGVSALDDQSIAGAIMWVPGFAAFLLPAAILGMLSAEAQMVSEPMREWQLRHVTRRKCGCDRTDPTESKRDLSIGN
jgi:cytochrome c oxidase assembly factor CtaG